MPHNMSVNLRPHVICSKTGGSWVEVVVVFLVHTNRWDPILNYPGSKEVVPCRHQYLKYYSSDFPDFGITLKLKL